MADTQGYKDKSLSELMGELSKFTDAGAARAEGKIKEVAQNYRPIDPAILQAALQSGGALSNGAALAGGDFWGMTPERFNSFVATRQSLPDQIKEATVLSDTLSGNSVTRKALEESIAREQAGVQSNIGTASSAFTAQQGRAQAADQFNRNEAQQDRQFNVNKALQEKQMAQQASQFAQTLDQHERELMAIRKGAGTGGGIMATAGSPFANLEMAEKEYKDINVTAKAGEAWDRPAMEKYARSVAYKGSPVGSVINISQYAPDLEGGWFADGGTVSGFKHLILTDAGWYGFNEFDKDGRPDKKTKSAAPLIPMDPLYRDPQAGTGFGVAGGSGSWKTDTATVPKHAPKQ